MGCDDLPDGTLAIFSRTLPQAEEPGSVGQTAQKNSRPCTYNKYMPKLYALSALHYLVPTLV